MTNSRYHTFTVCVMDDEGAEFWSPVKVAFSPDLTLANAAVIALDVAREEARMAGRRVAEAHIDWQDTAETAMTRVEELTACAESIADCRHEDARGFEYYNADDVDQILRQYDI